MRDSRTVSIGMPQSREKPTRETLTFRAKITKMPRIFRGRKSWRSRKESFISHKDTKTRRKINKFAALFFVIFVASCENPIFYEAIEVGENAGLLIFELSEN
jgi:hypothetical protein